MTTILQGVVGSTAYGLATEDSDVDRLAVHVAPVEDLLAWGLTKGQESRVQHEPDITSHDIGKYLRLALRGNPTILELMWLPKYEVITEHGQDLLLHANAVLSARAVRDSYGGYAMQQMKRLLNRGDGSFSADTRKRKPKHARHCFRLLLQGEALLRTGRVEVVLSPEQTRLVWAVSELAANNEDEALQERFDVYNGRLDEAYGRTVLPEHPDEPRVRALLLKVRRDHLREVISQ